MKTPLRIILLLLSAMAITYSINTAFELLSQPDDFQVALGVALVCGLTLLAWFIGRSIIRAIRGKK